MPRLKVTKLPTIRRLPTYLYKLSEMRKAGMENVAAGELARYMNIGEIVVRKDLAAAGAAGKPRSGYRIDELISAIKGFLNWDNPSEAVLVGVGSLGSALLGYDGFSEYGLNIVAAFDCDENKVGREIRGRTCLGIDRLDLLCRRMNVKIGIICVPAAQAQSVADRLVAGGVKAIWNFANVGLDTPEDVIVQRETIAGGLAVLSVKLSRHIQPGELN